MIISDTEAGGFAFVVSREEAEIIQACLAHAGHREAGLLETYLAPLAKPKGIHYPEYLDTGAAISRASAWERLIAVSAALSEQIRKEIG